MIITVKGKFYILIKMRKLKTKNMQIIVQNLYQKQHSMQHYYAI